MDEDTSEENDFCIVSVEPFGNSKPREEWIRCAKCKFWAQEDCTPGSPTYVRQNCDSNYSGSMDNTHADTHTPVHVLSV